MKSACKLFPIFILMSLALVHTNIVCAQDKLAVTTPQHVALTSTNPLHLFVYETIQEYVQTQTQGYPGKVKLEIQPLDSRIRLGECDVMEAFTAQGSRLWGKTHIGVRCIQSVNKPWTIYVQVDVQVWGEYAVTALPVTQGDFVQAKDVVMQKGDLTKQPNGIVTDISVLEGKQAALNLPLGTVLRPELLKAIPVVLQGQSVKLSSSGQGFVVSADGIAMNTANAGQLVDVKVTNGQIVKGIAQASGIVEVHF